MDKLSFLLIVGSIGLVGQAPAEFPRGEIAKILEPILKDSPTSGMLIFEVVSGSRSEKAGLRIGDILTHYDGQPVQSHEELRLLAIRAVARGENKILIIVRRGEQELDAEFGLEPLGLKLVPVREGESRTLWRPDTNYQPDFRAIESILSHPHRWELVTDGQRINGWAHRYLSRQGDRLLLRIQSQVNMGEDFQKRDVVIGFVADRYLSIRSLRLSIQDELVLDLESEAGKLHGERVGVPVVSMLPSDTLSEFLGGLLATTVPQRRGQTLRCSYLPATSLTAAPFADLYCQGPEEVRISGRLVPVFRYELSVFGEQAAQYWLDANRQVLQIRSKSDLCYVRSSREEVQREFPDAERVFEEIEKIPDRHSDPKNN